MLDRFVNTIQREWAMFIYTVRGLRGHSMIALAIMNVLAFVDLFLREPGHQQTYSDIILATMEMFAPLIGIALFADLFADELDEGNMDLIQSSTGGAVAQSTRKTIHALAILTVFLALYSAAAYTVRGPFKWTLGMGIALPGALFFGAIALFAAVVFRNSVAGYAAGLCAAAIMYVSQSEGPLSFATYMKRDALNNYRFFEESNWLIAKVFFIFMAAGLLTAGITLTRPYAKPRRGGLIGLILLAGIVGAVTGVWKAKPVMRPAFPEPAIILDVREDDDRLTVFQGINRSTWRGRREKQSVTFKHTVFENNSGQWKKIEEYTAPAPASGIAHPSIEINAEYDPETFRVEAHERIVGVIDQNFPSRFFLTIPFRLRVVYAAVNGEQTERRKYGDLLIIDAPRPLAEGTPVQLDILFEGVFEPFESSREFDKNFIYRRDWFLRLSYWLGAFEIKGTIIVPEGYEVFSAEPLGAKDGKSIFQFAKKYVNHAPLCVGRPPVILRSMKETPILVAGTHIAPSLAENIAETARAALMLYEDMFDGPMIDRLSIVEDPYLASSGLADRGQTTIHHSQWAPENGDRLLKTILPHEIAHQWAMPNHTKWFCEGIAVFANYYYLDKTGDRSGQKALQDELDKMNRMVSGPRRSLSETTGVDLYPRAGRLFMTLRAYLGDEKFCNLIRSFYRVSKAAPEKNVIELNDEFAALIYAENDLALTRFVEDTLDSEKLHDPAVCAVRAKSEVGIWKIEIDFEQRGEIRFFTPFRIYFVDGTCIDKVWKGLSENETIRYEFPRSVTAVEIDPDRLLDDGNRENNRALIEKSKPSATPAHEQIQKNIARSWYKYTKDDGLVDLQIQSLSADEENRIYAGLAGTTPDRRWAINVFEDKQWKDFGQEDNLPFGAGEDVRAILPLGTDDFLIAVRRKDLGGIAVTRRTSGSIRSHILGHWRASPRPYLGEVSPAMNPNEKSDGRLPGSVVYQMVLDPSGGVWIGTDHGAVRWNLDDDSIDHYRMSDGLPSDEVLDIFVASNGKVWAGTVRGLAVFEGGSWRAVSVCGLDWVLAIAEDHQGRLWIGTYRKGVIVWDGNKRKVYNSWNSKLRHNLITDIAVEPGGAIWIAGLEGLARFDGNHFEIVNTDNSELLSDHIRALLIDAANRLWVATDSGVCMCPLNDEIADPKTPPISAARKTPAAATNLSPV